MPADVRHSLAPTLLALALSACAAAVPGYSPDIKTQAAQEKAAASAAAAGRIMPDGSYALGAEEQTLDCKKLAGRMQVRIMQIRDFQERRQATALARASQTAATTVLGGSSYGADPAAEFARDRAMLEAYNRRLAAKDCQTYDLDAELKPKPIDVTPRQIEKPKR